MRIILFLMIIVVSQSGAAACVSEEAVKVLKMCQHNLKILVGVTPGGASDVFARELSKFTKQFDLNITVINKTGASGNIAAGELIKDDDNDCKFMMGTAASLFLNKFNDQLNPKIDPENHYQPIGLVATNPMFLAINRKKINVKSIDEALKRPGHSTHIPVKGASEALGLLLGGEVEFVLDNPSTLRTTFGNADILILGNTSSTDRTINGLKVPPLSSWKKLSGVEGHSAFGLVANHRVSSSSAKAMENILSCLAADSDFKKTYSAQGYDIRNGSAADLRNLTAEQLKYWKPIAEIAFRSDETKKCEIRPAAGVRQICGFQYSCIISQRDFRQRLGTRIGSSGYPVTTIINGR